MQISNFVKHSCENWPDFFERKSKNLEQTYLSPDTHRIIKDYLIANSIGLLNVEINRLEEILNIEDLSDSNIEIMRNNIRSHAQYLRMHSAIIIGYFPETDA